MNDPRTPDFHDHATMPLAEARLDDRFVHLAWPDGARLTAFDAWLLEVTVGKGTDPVTREGVIDPAGFSDTALVVGADIDPGGHLLLTWADGDVDALHAGWLHDVAVGRLLPDADLPAPEPWTTEECDAPPEHDAEAVLHDDDALDAHLVDLLRRGLTRLVGAPTDPAFLVRLAGRIGPIRPTNFGSVWDVRADVDFDGDPERNSTANSRRRLPPHTDLPSRETPPGFQFLHCIENSVTGGWSTMTDGAAVVRRLAEVDPDGLQLLSSRRWIFINRGRGIDHRWSAPLIDHGADGSLTLRAFHPVRACPDMPADDVPRAYAALARLHRIAEDGEFQLRFPFRPGDVVCFDNRRILHGRDAYETAGQRHLRGCYLDADDVRSTARLMARRRSGPVARRRADASARPDPDPTSHEEHRCPTASSSPAQ